MSKQIVDFVNPQNLVWCRKKAGLDIPAVYKKASWSASTKKVEAWEKGEEFPSIDELKKLGQVYKKAWTLFLLKENIGQLGFMVMKDYRGSIQQADEQEKYELTSFANEMESRQQFLIEFADVLKIKTNNLFGSLVQEQSPEKVARVIIEHFQIDFEKFWKESTRRKALNFLQEQLGEHNVFVSFSSTNSKKQISLKTMRGMLVRSSRAPIIGINSAEKSVGAQIFTIFHELTHLLVEPVNENEIFVEQISFRNTDKKTPKERFCDKVSAIILIPASILKELEGKTITVEVVEEYCKKLKINVEPFLYRVSEHGLLSENEVDSLIKQCKQREEQDKASQDTENRKKPDGGLLHLLKNGKSFTKSVNTLYTEGVISYAQALGVLNTKSATFNKYVNR